MTDVLKTVFGWSPAYQLMIGGLSLVFVGAVGWGIVAFVQAPGKAAIAKTEAHASQVQGTASAGLDKAAINTLAQAAQRDQKAVTTHEENSRVIHSLPSASGAIADGDADAWRRGLCLYGSTSGDPACAGLQRAHP